MSLKRIALRDFVIVSELELDLSPGFTVLTGETGAGKSILIDALQLATGARADTGWIREGAGRTEVSAEFDTSASLDLWLQEAGFDAGETILLRRSVDAQGKSRAWVNGSAATVGQLRQLGEQLLDIHGQHAWQSLTRPESVRQLLDDYGNIPTRELGLCWQGWRDALNRLEHAQAAQGQLHNERERLTWQIGELEKLKPEIGEWDALNTEHSRLSHAQALLDAAQGALELLDAEGGGVIHQLTQAVQMLRSEEHNEPEFKELIDVLNSSLAQAEDCGHSLRSYLRRTEPNPARLSELDSRMASWLSMARRYKRAPEDLAELLVSWKAELETLETATDLQALREAECAAQQSYMKAAQAVSRQRVKAAPKLAQAITQAMQGLGMSGGQFEVVLGATAQPQQYGLEDVAFLVAGHAGSTPRAVNKVASGGELSRIALAIAVTTSQLGTAQTLIFDEVDAGVGGAVAETVGRLMQQLGRDRQVLAVTHLPQVAACADQHLVVSKQQQGRHTVSSVSAVRGEERVAEIARMLGGERLSGTTLAHAKEMLQSGG